MRAKVNNAIVILVNTHTLVNFCDACKVENTQRAEKVMIMDPGAPMSLAEKLWLSKCLAEFDCIIEDMVSSSFYQVFYSEELTKGTKVY